MSVLTNKFKALQQFAKCENSWEEIQEIHELDSKSKNATNEKFLGIPFIRLAIDNWKHLFTMLQELISILNKEATKDEVTWNELISIMPRDQYLSIIYSLIALNSLDTAYTQLTISAAKVYLLSLTVSGSKGFHIFEESIIAHVLEVFTVAEKIQHPNVLQNMTRKNVTEIWIDFTDFCDTIKIFLRGVHLDNDECIRNEILKRFIEIQLNTYTFGSTNSYAVILHNKCFEIFDEIISKGEGGHEQIFLKIMNLAIDLHTHLPKPRGCNSSEFEHISDWFIKCIPKYSSALQIVLSAYIEKVIKNPDGRWKNEQGQRSLDYAAKYDAALLKMCNTSSAPFLLSTVYAAEVPIRCRCIDLMTKLLLLETNNDFKMTDNELMTVPREVLLIKELILSIQDYSNQVKFKAAQALQQIFDRGSVYAKKILTECLRYSKFKEENIIFPDMPLFGRNEIQYRKPIDEIKPCPIQGWNTIEDAVNSFPQIIYENLFRNSVIYIRRAGVILIQTIAKLNPLIIFNTHFVQETVRLADEPSVAVRKQILTMIDSVLSCYPNCLPVVWVWCGIISPMLSDEDPKNAEYAMECFVSKVFANVRPETQSIQAEHDMPWLIVRTLIERNMDSRLYLQNCFHKMLKPHLVTSKMYSSIEYHTTTCYALEAWILLNFIAGKVDGQKADNLIQKYISIESMGIEDITTIAIEVLIANLPKFSQSSLNFIFDHFLSKFRNATIHPACIISKAFDFIVGIDKYRQSKNCDDWRINLYEQVESEIISLISSIDSKKSKLWTLLDIYSVINVTLVQRPNREIIQFIQKCMRNCLKISAQSTEIEESNLNTLIVISGRLAMRDAFDVDNFCRIYGRILNKIDLPNIVEIAICALLDLGKKYMQIVEKVLEQILDKLSSPYIENRLTTFESVTELVLQDQIKLRGSVLLALLNVILDQNDNLSMKAMNFFDEFSNIKNPFLLQKCLIECPFVLNEYANFDGLDSFAETTIRSSLKGSDNRSKRKKLYNYLMKKIDMIQLLLYLDNLKLIAEKSRHDPMINTPEGIAMIVDLLFIFRRICQITFDQKSSIEKNDEANEESLEGVEISNNNESTNPTTSTAVKTQSTKRRRVLTMADALNSVEKSLTFLPIIANYADQVNDALLTKSVKNLANAICRRFPNYVEYAQPQEFWKNYFESSSQNGAQNKLNQQKKKDKSREDSSNVVHENSIQSDSYSDDDIDATDDSTRTRVVIV